MPSGQSVVGRQISAALWYAVVVYSSVRTDLILELRVRRKRGRLSRQTADE